MGRNDDSAPREVGRPRADAIPGQSASHEACRPSPSIVDAAIDHGIEPINRTCVFGLSQDGKYYTLRDVTTPGPGFSAPGFEQETLSGRSMLVTHTPIEPNPIIDLLNIRLTGLREWVGRKPSSETSTFSESGDETTEFRIASEDIRDYTLFECEEAKVVIRYSGRRAGGPIPSYQFSYTDDYLLQIALPKGDVSLDEAIEGWCLPLWNFLSFCMRRVCSVYRRTTVRR